MSCSSSAGLDAADERYEIRAKVPILVDEGVLDKAGIVMDKDGDKDTSESGTPPKASSASKPLSKEELERMSAFTEFLQDLPGLEDLGEMPRSGS